MPAPADPSPRADERLTRLLGFGEHSVSKSYYPELRRRLEELERFRSLLDQTGDAIFLVDVATGRIADAAGAAGAMLRQERGDLRGLPFEHFLPPDAVLRLRVVGDELRVFVAHEPAGTGA